ncbi:glycosyltransferase [Empedobacter tilapiae]
MQCLTIIISTLNNGILGLEKTIKFKHPEILYLVIHQNHTDTAIPLFLKRDDIQVIQSDTKGLSKSRNTGIKNCTTEYALIADDDVEYIESGLLEVLNIIKTEKPDFATFKIKTFEKEQEYKNYPQVKYQISISPLHWFSSIEILFNVNLIKDYKIKFDERFGLGTYLKKGEEEIFINDIISEGLEGYYYPIYVVQHPYESSGKKKISEKFKFFYLGAFYERVKKKQSIKYVTTNKMRYYKTKIAYFFGKLYIRYT